MKNQSVLSAIGLAASCLPALGATILVPQGYPTIQAAINAAGPGDTIVVAPGTYSGAGNRDLNLMGKAITVRSAAGAASCIINAGGLPNQPHCGFLIQNSETANTVIDGFTITGGYQFNGGGVYVHSGGPTIRNCIITGNSVGCWGGGVYCETSSTPRFFNCVIVGNTSTDEGGGVFSISASPRIENCIIADNSASVGAGACIFGGDPMFINCRVTGNNADLYGGGMYLPSGRLVNCTVAGNSALYQGAALYMGGNATVTNSIIWANAGPTPVASPAGISYSIVQGGMLGIGNSAADPLFVNAALGDFRLSSRSPGIDAGSNAQVPAGVTTDLSGGLRFFSVAGTPIVDLGAFEVRPLLTSNGARPH